VLAPQGRTGAAHRPPGGGWDISCICGWDGGNWPIRTPAQLAYRKHLDHQIDDCLHLCRRCGEEKPLGEMRSDYRHVCKDCFSVLGREWQNANPEASARHKRNHHLLKKFGITVAEAEQMLADQGGLCFICLEEITDPRGWAPHVDHDHATEKVRGILCFHCNAGLGQFDDDPERLRRAADYVERSRS
jgi:hypothetical protein